MEVWRRAGYVAICGYVGLEVWRLGGLEAWRHVAGLGDRGM